MNIQLFGSLLCDVVIAGSLIYYFKANLATLEPMQGNPNRMATILKKLIVFSVNQGLLLWCVSGQFVPQPALTRRVFSFGTLTNFIIVCRLS